MPYHAEHPTLAVIDIGSNSVRMVIYDLLHEPPIKTFNEKLFCALGRDLGTTGYLNQDGVVAALKAIKAYALICEVQQVETVVTVGTAALREAKDGPDFIRTVKEDSGLDIRVISGDEEARYAANGVLMQFPDAEGIVADFGGGSLEFARIKNGQIIDTISLPLGAYRVLALGEQPDAEISAILTPLIDRFGYATTLYAIGGAWRSLSGSYHSEKGLEGGAIACNDLQHFAARIEKMTTEDLQSMYRLELPRAKLAPVAAYTLRQVLGLLRPQMFMASIAGVRDGIVHEHLSSRLKTR